MDLTPLPVSPTPCALGPWLALLWMHDGLFAVHQHASEPVAGGNAVAIDNVHCYCYCDVTVSVIAMPWHCGCRRSDTRIVMATVAIDVRLSA